MPSWQARLFSFVLRHTFKRKLAAARDISAIRAVMNRAGRYTIPSILRITPATINDVDGDWTEGPTKNHLMLFLHGGGYIGCTLKTHRPYACFFALHGFRVFMPDYRLAPEHPFPKGLDDAVAAYRGLCAAHPNKPIVIAGDSAGGGLALATMLRLRDEGDALPKAAALFSPFTDLTNASESRRMNDRLCAMFHSAGLDEVPGFYVPGADAESLNNPLISPVYADYTGFPPLLIHVGADETLRDDSVRLAAKAREAGVHVELKVWPAVPHDWQLAYNMIPEGRQSLEEASAFLKT